MTKIIINIEDDNINHKDALWHVNEVIKSGFVSNNNTEYCYVTLFNKNIYVYAKKTKTGSFTFKVWRINEI